MRSGRGIVRAFVRWGTLLLLATAGCERAPRQPTGNLLDDLSIDAVAVLRALLGVANVTRSEPNGQPTHRIVHLLDWHFITRDDYAADLGSASDMPQSDEEVDRSYAEFLDEVEDVQRQQLAFLRALARNHGVTRVHIEGLAERDRFIFDAKIDALRDIGQKITELRKQRDALAAESEDDPEASDLVAGNEEIEAQHRRDILQVGAAGQLLLSGEIEVVLPLEDADAYAKADPVGDDGTVRFDQEKIEARQDAQVRLLLESRPFCLAVLGGGNDLSDNAERISGGQAEYLRVELEAGRSENGE